MRAARTSVLALGLAFGLGLGFVLGCGDRAPAAMWPRPEPPSLAHPLEPPVPKGEASPPVEPEPLQPVGAERSQVIAPLEPATTDSSQLAAPEHPRSAEPGAP